MDTFNMDTFNAINTIIIISAIIWIIIFGIIGLILDGVRGMFLGVLLGPLGLIVTSILKVVNTLKEIAAILKGKGDNAP